MEILQHLEARPRDVARIPEVPPEVLDQLRAMLVELSRLTLTAPPLSPSATTSAH